MKDIENRIEFIDIAMLVALMICVVVGNYSPVFSFILMASVIPMILIGANANVFFKGLSLVLAVAGTYVLFGQEVAMETFLIYLLPAFLSSLIFLNEGFRDSNNRKVRVAFKKNSEVYHYASLRVFMVSIILFMVGTVAYFAAMKYTMNVDVINILQERIKDIVSSYKSIVTSSDFKFKDLYGGDVFDQILQNTGTIIMISVFIKSMILAIVSYFFAIPILNNLCKKKIFNIKFDCIMLPGNPVGVVVITIITLFVIGYAVPGWDTSVIINNFMFVMNILFFLEGLSLLVFAVRRWSKVKKNINWILMLVLMIFLGVLPGIAILGMLDNLWNYRMKWDPGIKNFGGKNE